MSSYRLPKVVDEFFPASTFDDITHLFHECTWKFGWGSNAIGEAYVHWNRHFAGGGKSSLSCCEEELFGDIYARPIAEAWKNIRDKLLPSGHKLVRCYANSHTFGLDGTIHRDNPDDIEALTTIVYSHRLWPTSWGGETMFYSDDGSDVIASVFPKPGRIAVFQGSVPHSAKSPSRVCKGLRISLVFKSIKDADT